MFKIDGMIPIQVGTRWDSRSITGPECECQIISWKMEGVRMLAETVNVSIVWEHRLDTKILLFKYNGVGLGREQDLVR